MVHSKKNIGESMTTHPGKKNSSMSPVTVLLLFLCGAVVGTGAYTLSSVMMYALLGVVFALYAILTMKRTFKVNLASNVLLLIYLVFLALNYLRDMGDATVARLYLNFLLGIGTYLVLIKVFSLAPDMRRFRYLPLLSLLVIAAGIVLQLNGFISFRGDEEIASMDEGLLLRPGGFLNPNMSAALSLIWLFSALESKADISYWQKLACVAICIFVLSMTQSRAAWLFLSLYVIYKSWEGGARVMKYYWIPVVLLILMLPFISQMDALTDIYNSILLRFQGDGSSDERFLLLQSAMGIFADNPILGRGMRTMYRFFGLATHNETVEWLVNFGMVGFFVMCLVVARFYYIGSFKYLCLCILPTFLFSHNFFETTAFQVALACAFAFATRPLSYPSLRRAPKRRYVPTAGGSGWAAPAPVIPVLHARPRVVL
ncbi:MAG TPA: O-antigen ligase family protein [Noviherbaspirillum sp.]|nr:O-antigen ligase family protein [Noviherbaspirillum sp.]